MTPNIFNPYRYASASIDDTGLKCYWKFNESSGDVINQSESSVDLGSSADIQITNGDYEDNGSPLGNGMAFNGSDAFGVAGTSVSQFNFLHQETTEWTICFWAKLTKAEDKFIMTTAEGSTDIGIKLGMNATSFRIYTLNGADQTVMTFSGSSGFIPDSSGWYFYVFRYDTTEEQQFKALRDNANLEESSNTVNSATNNNATYPMYFARRPNPAIGYTVMAIAEVSVWDRILTDAQMTALFNGGSGQAIY